MSRPLPFWCLLSSRFSLISYPSSCWKPPWDMESSGSWWCRQSDRWVRSLDDGLSVHQTVLLTFRTSMVTRWRREKKTFYFIYIFMSDVLTLAFVLKYDISPGSFRRVGMWLKVERVESGLVFASVATSMLWASQKKQKKNLVQVRKNREEHAEVRRRALCC